MALDEPAAWRNLIAHQHVEDLVGFYGFFDADLQDGTVRGVHGGVPECFRVHLAQTFVAAHLWLFAVVAGFVFLDEAVALFLGVDIMDGLTHLDVVERWLGDIEMPAGDKRLHVAIEEGQQQGANVRPVNVGVAHDNDAAVAQLGDVETFVYARANGRDDIFDLFIFQDFVQTHTLDIEDFAAQGQDGLEVTVASLFRAPSSTISLD